MVINRPFWQKRIEQAWKEKTIVWLMGVRRVGKTSLCKSLKNIKYFDCDLPKIRQSMQDPERFLERQKGKRIILDEIHRLDNPSELLKIAADHYPEVKIIATGSSSLGASIKFRDTLTGRKREIWLTPLLLEEMKLFGNTDLHHRFLFGGLPSYFIKEDFPEEDFREWIDAYWAKDIQELFTIEKRAPFQKFTELILAHSGGQFEATPFAKACEISRGTAVNYLQVLAETFVVHIVRPFSSRKSIEIIKAPRVYGFDTGVVCYAKGWHTLRSDDLGFLWEHCILNEIQAHLKLRNLHYWRNKQGHEIDFVIPHRGHAKEITVIECKFRSSEESLGRSTIAKIVNNMQAFRDSYPNGENFVVASDIDIDHPFDRKYENMIINFVSPETLVKRLAGKII